MRFSGLFLCVALILCIQFTFVLSAEKEQKMIGVWSNPVIKTAGKCCVPDSITIEKKKDENSFLLSWTAEYQYSFSNEECKTLFDGYDSKLTISQPVFVGQGYGASRTTSTGGIFGGGTTSLVMSYTFKDTTLTVKDPVISPYVPAKCDYSMTSFKSTESSSGGSGAIIILLLALIGVGGFLFYKKQQQKQTNLISQDTNNASYVAPNNFNPQFPQPQVYAQPQPQQGYVQPQGFAQPMPMPNAQVTLNVNANAQQPM